VWKHAIERIKEPFGFVVSKYSMSWLADIGVDRWHTLPSKPDNGYIGKIREYSGSPKLLNAVVVERPRQLSCDRKVIDVQSVKPKRGREVRQDSVDVRIDACADH
jgi:hypothetical protein